MWFATLRSRELKIGSAAIAAEPLGDRRSKNGTRQDDGVKTDVAWNAVKRYAKRIGLDHLAPHDLRRTCARLCHEAGGELEQIQFLLSHASVQTTERYIGCKQNLKEAVNDRFQISLGRHAKLKTKEGPR
jgi:integrase